MDTIRGKPVAATGAGEAPGEHDMLCRLMGRAIWILTGIKKLLAILLALLTVWFVCWLIRGPR